MVGQAPGISIIVPTLNEGDNISSLLKQLTAQLDDAVELLVVDGGSTDGTVALASEFARVLSAPARGRAAQMNHGADVSRREILLFLHADTYLPAGAIELLRTGFWRSSRQWGRFDVRLSGDGFMFRVISFCMNLRSRVTGIATGDQALFMKRGAFEQVGGFPRIDLMEDVAISKALKRVSGPFRVKHPVTSSSRKWEGEGIFRTILRMWYLRLAFYFGTDPSILAKRYYGDRYDD